MKRNDEKRTIEKNLNDENVTKEKKFERYLFVVLSLYL